MSVCQLPLQSHREGASQTATGIDPCGYVEASISAFILIFFSQKDPLLRECVIVSVCQLPLQSHREGLSQTETGIVLCGYVEALILTFPLIFYSQSSPAVSVWHCVSVSVPLTELQGGCQSHSNCFLVMGETFTLRSEGEAEGYGQVLFCKGV